MGYIQEGVINGIISLLGNGRAYIRGGGGDLKPGGALTGVFLEKKKTQC